MDEKTLKEAFVFLNNLSKEEYRQTLKEVVNDRSNNVAERVGRLAGVILKEPFAEKTERESPSFRTRAYSEWHLLDASVFDIPSKRSTWQYAVLERIIAESSDDFIREYSVAQLAVYAQTERGLFGEFVKNSRDYICGDEKIRKRVYDFVKKGAGEIVAKNTTPEKIVFAGGVSFASYLMSVVPIVALVSAPVIGAIILIIYALGVDGFCKWSLDPNSDQIE